ncbi:MAG TPA: hypothetical protein VMX33_12440 [bacterium]|nr:hypothetical protein [bacterium]
MPDVPAALGPIAALLIPVLGLMFVALRLRRRVRYPHELLPLRNERSPAAALFRMIRLYFDTIIDATCAVLVGLALTGWPHNASPKHEAVVIDTSLSMASGMRGARPLDEATRVASTMLATGDDVFVLGWDPVTRSPTLESKSRVLDEKGDPVALATALDGSESFMSVSYDMLADLQRRYRSVALITDADVDETPWLRVHRLHAAPERYLYMASSTWDDVENRSVARFVTAGGAALSALWEVLDDGSLVRAKPEDYRIAPSDSGFSLSFRRAGLWAVQWQGHILPFEAPGAPGAYRADGAFSSMIAAALYPSAGRYGDSSSQEVAVTIRDGGGRNRRGTISILRAEREDWVLDPANTLGAAVAAGYDRRADMALGPAALSAPQTAMPFWLARAASTRRIAGNTVVTGRTAATRVGDGFLYVRPGQAPIALIVPPIAEYAHDPRPIVVPSKRSNDARLLLTLALALLFGAKLLVARYTAVARRTAVRTGRVSPGSAPQNQV